MKRGKPNSRRITPAVRRWLYGIALAAAPVALAFGANGEQTAALVALAGALLGVSTLAITNVNKD